MKIISVYLDDYDRPFVARLVADESEVEGLVAAIEKADLTNSYLVEVDEPTSIEDVLQVLQQED